MSGISSYREEGAFRNLAASRDFRRASQVRSAISTEHLRELAKALQTGAKAPHGQSSLKVFHLAIDVTTGVAVTLYEGDPRNQSLPLPIATCVIDGKQAGIISLRAHRAVGRRAFSYRGRGTRHSAGMTWTMDGELTIRGVTKVVPLKVVFNGTAAPQPGKPARISFHATAGVKRADFGMTRELLEELGARPSPGPDVEIEIDTEALINEAK